VNAFAGSPGVGVDAQGGAVIDPTENVKELVAASILRLDDLRIQSEKYIEKIVELQAKHETELREKEAERIDAIRTVDVAANQQATKDAEIRASALAKQVTDSAEAMRSQVAAAAAAAATSLAAALVSIQESLAELTRRMYEQQGQKQQVVESRASDADFAPILEAITRLQATANENSGGRKQVAETRANFTLGQGLVAVLILLVTASAAVYTAIHRGSTLTPTPTVVCSATYHPAPCPQP
jgi:hypothetical protein